MMYGNPHHATNTPPVDVDEATVREFVSLIHEQARQALDGVERPGFLQLSRLHPLDETLVPTRFRVGDTDGMAEQAIADARAGHNVYVEGRTISEQTPRAARGDIQDTAFVFALVDDSDADKGKAANRDLNGDASLVVETSPGNKHNWFFLKQAVRAAEAKPIGEAMRASLGSDSDTGTVTQPYRVAGTPNFPGKTKQKRGRIKVERTSILHAQPDRSWTLEELRSLFASPNQQGTKKAGASTVELDWAKVAEHAGWLKTVADLPIDFSAKGRMIVAHSGSIKDLNDDLMQAGLVEKPYKSDWSSVSFALATIFKADGRFEREKIAAALLCNLDCNQHVTKQKDEAKRSRAVERLLARSHEPTATRAARALPWRECKPNGTPLPTVYNAMLAVTALGIECSHDTFHNSLLVGFKGDDIRHELKSVVGEVSDNAILRLRHILSRRFGIDFQQTPTRDAVITLALDHCFDPVCDMLTEAEDKWDGVARLDKMAVDYFNCEDTPLDRAFIRKMMIAAVRRARHPGCKFDNIVVLESDEGLGKSTALRVLAGDENFSDQSILGKREKEIQETMAGVWIHESADLSGMKKAQVEDVKAFASRQVDRARPAYGHFQFKQKRSGINTGTTNADKYLQSQTGNRRFWPLKVLKSIDIEKLRRDRLLLWGEAAKYERDGESINIPEELWPAAGEVQEKRRTVDPWESIVADLPKKMQIGEDAYRVIIHTVDNQERVATADLLDHVLHIPRGQQEPRHTMRLSTVMKRAGWERDENKITIYGKQVRGYFRSIPEPTPHQQDFFRPKG